MTAPLFDTHCHLQDAAFAADLDAVVGRARAAGVEALVVCAYDEASLEPTLDIARKYDIAHAALGIHPHDAKDIRPETLERIERAAMAGGCVAIGEIGLDYYRDHSPRQVQMEVLEAQLDIATRTGLPVSVHSREAESAILAPLEDYARRTPLGRQGLPVGVMHCFGGALSQARRFVDLGFKISIPCTITYPRNERARELAAELPLESIVIETDAPYLPPQDRRGQRNEPAYVDAVVAAIARVRGEDGAAIAAATTSNARSVFRLAGSVPAPAEVHLR